MPSAPEIPLDIREAMHDCILAVFWPKKKIAEFFESVGCQAKGLTTNSDLSRHMIVTQSFESLRTRDDRGYQIFQTMVDRLSNWSYFDPYYFDELKKLDRADAEQKISRLKNAVERRNSVVREQRTSSSRIQKKHNREVDLAALTKAFGKMFGTGMSPQARGKLFETFLRELFDRQSIKMGDPFRLLGEEIDGSFKFEGENYITEAKWQEARASTNQLYGFAHKIDGKMHGRGFFISVNGFSSEGIKAIVLGKHIKTILMDGQDLSHVLESRISLEQMLDYKIRAAQTRGDVYVCPIIDGSKV